MSGPLASEGPFLHGLCLLLLKKCGVSDFCFSNRLTFAFCSIASPDRGCETPSQLQESPRAPTCLKLCAQTLMKKTENDLGNRQSSLMLQKRTRTFLFAHLPYLCYTTDYHQPSLFSTNRVSFP